MDKIDRAIITLNASGSASPSVTLRVDARCQIIITLVYLGLMLSVPLSNLQMLAWYACYPILWSTLCGISYGRVFRRSLIALPFVLFIGIFNPLIDHQTAFACGPIKVTRGWVTFASIVVRGLLSVQAVIVLVNNVGFIPMCRALSGLGTPSFLVTQLMLLYRYLIVLLEETRTMWRARQSRGMQRLTLRLWSTMIGQLFVRTVNRAERIQQAMAARGFNGTLRYPSALPRLTARDAAIAAAWIATFVFLRVVNVAALLHLQ